jgi:hypothetical protein
MPTELTELTEIVTGLGTLSSTLDDALAARPAQLTNVNDDVWSRLCQRHASGINGAAFATAFDNGQAFLHATDGLRGRPPVLVEWKGPHRPPGDDVIPADLRIDHVFLVSCKYLSKNLFNPGPSRLFERLLVGDDRSTSNWFDRTAPTAFLALYTAATSLFDLTGMPARPADMTKAQRRNLKAALQPRKWPAELEPLWNTVCAEVAAESARVWTAAMPSNKHRLRLLWRLLRITTATYFILGADTTNSLRLRVDSAWDWQQAYELRSFEVRPRTAGQPEVGWHAVVRRRRNGVDIPIDGHIEVRWSHGRFYDAPEAKVYVDIPHTDVPGYNALT